MISDKPYTSIPYEALNRPVGYPIIEEYPELLFYIQRNQNHNTVVYELNTKSGALLNQHEPMLIHWLRFDNGRFAEMQPLNYIQKKLAYGYKSEVIAIDLIAFELVSYDEIRFFLGKDNKDRYRVFFVENEKNIMLKSIFIYAEDLGVFPQVKWAELSGEVADSGAHFYKKIVFEDR